MWNLGTFIRTFTVFSLIARSLFTFSFFSYKPSNPFYANKSRTIEDADQSVEWLSHETSSIRYFGQLVRDNSTLYNITDFRQRRGRYGPTYTPVPLINTNLTFVRGLLLDFRFGFSIYFTWLSIINFSLFGESNATIGIQPGRDNIFVQLYEKNLIKKPIVSFYFRDYLTEDATRDGFLNFI